MFGLKNTLLEKFYEYRSLTAFKWYGNVGPVFASLASKIVTLANRGEMKRSICRNDFSSYTGHLLLILASSMNNIFAKRLI